MISQVVASSNGYVKVYELMNPMELKNWQLQVIMLSNRAYTHDTWQLIILVTC